MIASHKFFDLTCDLFRLLVFAARIPSRNITLFLLIWYSRAFLFELETLEAEEIDVGTERFLLFVMNAFSITLVHFITIYVLLSWNDVDCYLSEGYLVITNIYLAFVLMMRL